MGVGEREREAAVEGSVGDAPGDDRAALNDGLDSLQGYYPRPRQVAVKVPEHSEQGRENRHQCGCQTTRVQLTTQGGVVPRAMIGGLDHKRGQHFGVVW